MPVIHWFRRDLRLSDNMAFNAAIHKHGGVVIPVFILDESLLRGKDVAPIRVQFLAACLSALDQSLRALGSRLIIRRGDPALELARLACECEARCLTFNDDYTPYAEKRDQRVAQALQSAGAEVCRYTDQVIHGPQEVLTNAGRPYTVFTPYKRKWQSLSHPQALPAPITLMGNPQWDALPSTTLEGLCGSARASLPTCGEAAAQANLELFIRSGKLAAYATQRDQLALKGTSRLSAYLRFGTLSPRTCLQAAQNAGEQAHEGADAWINELIWREFYMQVLHHHPYADHANYQPGYDHVWGSGSATQDAERFAAWCAGDTGYPIVDAAMHQLNETAWMHNRARMIVASFLTRDLHLDWRLGESYFMRKLVDGDPALNNGGWQWAAGTGTDAQPYFRVFNPVLQGQRFDASGDYVRKFVPSLARVPLKYLHEPWKMPAEVQRASGCIIGGDYPMPIVDHDVQKAEIVRRFKGGRP